jgi:hypothetical protein
VRIDQKVAINIATLEITYLALLNGMVLLIQGSFGVL